MIAASTATALIAKYGLAIVAPIAVLEGPLITVIAAWLASQGLMSLWGVILVVILADLIGDMGFYALGRYGLDRMPNSWRRRAGLTQERLDGLTHHFEDKGGRTLVLGKITHAMGFAVLVAAGMARMPFARFGLYNLIGTVPKSLFFVALGYAFGAAYAQIGGWISGVTLGIGILILSLGTSWFIYRKLRK